jgi:hypothetical protein
MMDLLERYLAEVRRNLPARDADDIVAELRDLLLARAEEQEETAGSVDWDALLKEFGHPLVIAARYRKQQWLIGPELYPFYLHFLKVIVTIVIAVTAGLAVLKGVLWAASPGQAITGFLGSLWWGAASAIGSVTIVFALLERFGGTSAKRHLCWKPMELPELNASKPSVYESVFEVAVGVLILLWWFGLFPTPQFNGSFRLVAAPIWQTLFWPVAALMTLQLAFNLVRWLRPRWSPIRAVLGAVNSVAAIVIAAIVYRAGTWITVVPIHMSQAEASGLQSALDLAFRIGIVVVLIIWLLNFGAELWRMVRSLGGARPRNGGASPAPTA